MLINILLVVHMLSAVSIVVLVLLQQGKGADMGAAFGGGGGSQSVFGSRGSGNFLSRTTAVLATLFFITSLSLAYVYSQQSVRQSVTSTTPVSTKAAQDDAAKEAAEPTTSGDAVKSETVKGSDEIPTVPGQPAKPTEGDVPAVPK